jgi:hypothetical protein
LFLKALAKPKNLHVPFSFDKRALARWISSLNLVVFVSSMPGLVRLRDLVSPLPLHAAACTAALQSWESNWEPQNLLSRIQNR